jgi:gold/copper resistance efflux system membrane fusion protein
MRKGKCVPLIMAAISAALAIAGCKEAAPSATPAKPPNSLTAIERVKLRLRVAGYIQDVSVPEGRFVEKGRKLFLIDPRGFQATLDAATARLRKAKVALTLTQSDYVRAEQLFTQKVVARERLDAATASLNMRKAQVDAAKAALDAAQMDLSLTRVVAPISGRIGQVFVTEGKYDEQAVHTLRSVGADTRWASA